MCHRLLIFPFWQPFVQPSAAHGPPPSARAARGLVCRANMQTGTQAHKHTGGQARKQTNGQARKQTSGQARKQTSGQARKQTSGRARKQTSGRARKHTLAKQSALRRRGSWVLWGASQHIDFPFVVTNSPRFCLPYPCTADGRALISSFFDDWYEKRALHKQPP